MSLKSRADYWVYKVYDPDLALIYVGVTGAGAKRLSAHSRGSDWAPLASTLAIEHFTERPAALERERELIQEHAPRFNVSANPRALSFTLADGEISASEAAAITRSSAKAIRRAIRSGGLHARQGTRGAQVIALADLHAWVDAHRIETPAP